MKTLTLILAGIITLYSCKNTYYNPATGDEITLKTKNGDSTLVVKNKNYFSTVEYFNSNAIRGDIDYSKSMVDDVKVVSKKTGDLGVALYRYNNYRDSKTDTVFVEADKAWIKNIKFIKKTTTEENFYRDRQEDAEIQNMLDVIQR